MSEAQQPEVAATEPTLENVMQQSRKAHGAFLTFGTRLVELYLAGDLYLPPEEQRAYKVAEDYSRQARQKLSEFVTGQFN